MFVRKHRVTATSTDIVFSTSNSSSILKYLIVPKDMPNLFSLVITRVFMALLLTMI